MTKGKLKEEKQQKEKIVSDEDHCQNTRDYGKNNVEKNTTQSNMKVKHDDEEDCLDEKDSFKKAKKNRKEKYQTTSESSGIATDEKKPKGKVGKGKDKSDRKLHKSTKESVHEDSNCTENYELSNKRKKKEAKDGSAMLQSLEEMEHSAHKHDKRTKKSRKKHEGKRFREDDQEINMEVDVEIVSNVDNFDNGKKKRKRKAESTLDTGNSENEDIEVLGSDHDKVSKETDFVKRKKKKKSKDQSQQKSKPTEHPGLDYLHTWYTNRQHWNFKKVRQIWLLQNMFDQEQIPDEDFCILLKYLEGLKGAAKDKTIEMAEKRIESDTGDHDAVVESRVQQVLQLLTE